MKVPKARKLPSGKWCCRVMINGSSTCITRATEKEAIAEAMEIKAGLKQAAKRLPSDKTLREVVEEYIQLKEDVLSPVTIRGYYGILRNRFPSIMNVKLSALTPVKVQSAIRAELKRCSEKTVQNGFSLVSSAYKLATG